MPSSMLHSVGKSAVSVWHEPEMAAVLESVNHDDGSSVSMISPKAIEVITTEPT